MTDVAIIGLACRFPSADQPRDLWRVVRDGVEATQLRHDVAEFDADFFNLSPREACAMDPRQRLALELSWELFEDAFVLPETLRGEQVSIYLGAMTDDYALLALRDAPSNLDNLNHHSFAGISRGMIANRISYAFGLRGSSMTVDSGQSSSLVAVHLACESLRTGASPLAIAGGIHLNLADETALLEAEFGALSASGHTYAFDERADGYVRSEGGALVLLKPLRAALEDGDRIRAIIRASAVGNAGHSSAGQTVPSVSGQADVIRRALFSASLNSDDIDYIEAHGTGTEIGDPVEARALGEIFAGRRDHPVSVGSVKTNIGHAGSAAGIAGLLKAVLALENGVIPPSLNYATAISGVDLKKLGLHVNIALTPWPVRGRPRRAGVSSFGMGGTNAHVILEEAPAAPESPAGGRDDAVVAWVLSGRSAEALTNQAARLAEHVRTHEGLGVADVGWSLATTRSVFEHRAVLVGAEREQFVAELTELAGGQPGAALLGRARPAGKTVFVFPGQGSQWLGMGTALYERFPLFANAFDEAVRALDGYLRIPLKRVIWGDDAALLENTEFAQPALFALEVALAALWQSWGAVPDLVMGHSVGEITAAYVAGVLSLADAAKVVAARGRLMAGLPAGGAMVAVAASEDEVAPLLTRAVSIAAVNGPTSVVISGEQAAVGAIADRMAGQGRRVHRLAVSHAFHSSLMEPILEEFGRVVADVSADQPRMGLVSNVTGQLAGPGYGSPRYWVDHVRRPVRFVDGVLLAESLGAEAFVEVGPGAALTAAVDQSLTAEHAISVVTLADDRSEIDSLLRAAGHLFTAGLTVDWSAGFTGLAVRPVELPTYGFARHRYWLGAGGDARPPIATRWAGLAEQLRALPPEEQYRQLLGLVCLHAATVLGHSAGHDIDAERAFQDLGFESMTGVELRNRLTTETGLVLSRTLIFDYPTPAALAAHLQELLHGDHEVSDDEKLWSTLRKIPVRELRRTGLLDKLLVLAGESEKVVPDSTVSDDIIDSLSPDALIAMALHSDEDDAID